MWKALSVIAALLVAGAAFLSFLNKNDVETERELLATAKSNLADINTRFNEVETEQKVAVRKTDKMKIRRDEAIDVRDAKEQELADKKREVEEAKQQNTDLKNLVDENDKKIAVFGTAEELLKIINGLQTDTIAVKTEISKLEDSLEAAENRKVATAQRIEEIKDLEFRQRNGQMKSINARIASVYNNWGFVVLNAGDNAGVVSRTKLNVERGGEKIAELLVTNLERTRSVADIIPGSMEPGQMIRPSDRVTVHPDSLPKPKAEAAAGADAGVVPGGELPVIPAAPDMAPDAGTPAGEPDPFDAFDTPTTPTTPTTPPAEATTPETSGSDDPFDF